MRNKTTMTNTQRVICFSIITVIILTILSFNRETEAEANEPKDYSFMSRSTTTIDTLEVENNEYRKQKEALNLLINTNGTVIAGEQCKIDKRDEKAICTQGLK